MSLENIVSDWLHAEAPERAPAQLLSVTLGRVAVVPQDRVLWRRRSATRRRGGYRPLFVIAATLVALSLLGGLVILGGGNQSPYSPPPEATTDPASQLVPVGQLATGGYHFDVSLQNYLLDYVRPHPRNLVFLGDGFTVVGPTARVRFDLPPGWSSDGVEVVKDADTNGVMTLGIGIIERLFIDPCHWSGHRTPAPLTRSVEGLVAAITDSWPAVVGPTRTTLDRFDASYMEVRTPHDVDPAPCASGQYDLWEGPDGRRHPAVSEQLDQIWVIDADGPVQDRPGGVLVVDAASGPGTSASDLAELAAIIDSIRIDLLPPSAFILAGPPRSLPASGTLESANYFMTNPYRIGDPVRDCDRGCSDYKQIIFNLPSGWAVDDGLLYKNLGQPTEVAFSVWTIDHTYADPCHWQTSAAPSPDPREPPGYGFYFHDELALMTQFGGTSATPVRLGGQEAIRVDQMIPADLDLSSCDGGEYQTWAEWEVADGGNSHHAAGQVDSVYVVDVDRHALIIDVSHMPGSSAQDIAELDGIVASMVIVR